jgi:hypothetical protein
MRRGDVVTVAAAGDHGKRDAPDFRVTVGALPVFDAVAVCIYN